MWAYEKKLQYPVNIKKADPAAAKIILTQLGGPDGEVGAAMRYLNQRYTMPYKECKGMLTDIGSEELGHMEMIAAIVFQLTRNLTPEQIKASGFDTYFVDHTVGIYPQSASGVPFTAASLQSCGDAVTDLFEDLAAEQKARTTYDNLLRLLDDPDVRDPIKFLREREIVHFQRFGETNRTRWNGKRAADISREHDGIPIMLPHVILVSCYIHSPCHYNHLWIDRILSTARYIHQWHYCIDLHLYRYKFHSIFSHSSQYRQKGR